AYGRWLPRVDRVLLRPAVAGAAFDQATRGRGCVGARNRSRGDDRRTRGARRAGWRRGGGVGTATAAHSAGARAPRNRRPVPTAGARASCSGAERRRVGRARRVGTSPARARSGDGEPAGSRLRRRDDGRRGAHESLVTRSQPTEASALPVIADRTRARPARRRDRARAETT